MVRRRGPRQPNDFPYTGNAVYLSSVLTFASRISIYVRRNLGRGRKYRTLKILADRIGVDEDTLRRWRSGATIPANPHLLEALLDTLVIHDAARDEIVHQWLLEAENREQRRLMKLVKTLSHGTLPPTGPAADNKGLPRSMETRENGSSEGRFGDPHLVAIASLLQQDRVSRAKARFTVDRIAEATHLRELWHIDAEAYGEANLDYSVYEKLWFMNRNGLFAMFLGDRVVGGLGVWPVTPCWTQAFAAGHLREAELPVDTPEFRGSRPAQHWYVSGIVLRPEHQSTFAASVLLREAAFAWAVQSDVIYPLHLSAIAISKEGERLLNRCGFSLRMPSYRMLDGFALYTREFTREDMRAFVRLVGQ